MKYDYEYEYEYIASFLPVMDESLEVKKSALLLVNTAVHHNPATVLPHLASFVNPILLDTLRIKLERTVDLGPFKHKVDDNLSLRKIALTCIESILDGIGATIDAAALMAVMPVILVDKDEIRLQAHQVLLKLALYSPMAVLAGIDALIDPLDKTANKKPPVAVGAGSAVEAGGGGGGAVAVSTPEIERAQELVRSAVKVAVTLNRICTEEKGAYPAGGGVGRCVGLLIVLLSPSHSHSHSLLCRCESSLAGVRAKIEAGGTHSHGVHAGGGDRSKGPAGFHDLLVRYDLSRLVLKEVAITF